MGVRPAAREAWTTACSDWSERNASRAPRSASACCEGRREQGCTAPPLTGLGRGSPASSGSGIG
eukprot:15476180-Alexandrium_andersonii.AAC.1